jgi:transcriptional regulator with XRE-family HTH domain
MSVKDISEYHPVDIHVGRRVRDRRKALGITQERLGEQLGLTFQQVQKYERGVNRVSASKLFEIAHVLQVPVNWFFEGDGAPAAEPDIRDSREARELVDAYAKLPTAKMRRHVLDLVKSMVANG